MTMIRQIGTLREAIARTKLAMESLEEPFSFPADCCPSCACGSGYKELGDKLSQQEKWLSILEAKRIARARAAKPVACSCVTGCEDCEFSGEQETPE